MMPPICVPPAAIMRIRHRMRIAFSELASM
jgi:hypothetical protein